MRAFKVRRPGLALHGGTVGEFRTKRRRGSAWRSASVRFACEDYGEARAFRHREDLMSARMGGTRQFRHRQEFAVSPKKPGEVASSISAPSRVCLSGLASGNPPSRA
jgi:hypothetical protein